jgi:hypothetical protein
MKTFDSMDERIIAIKKTKWIGYSKANETIQMLEELLAFPRTHRMPNLLIIGETNSGKTLIGKRFESMHPPRFVDAIDPQSGTPYQRIVMEVMMIQCPPVPNEKRLYIAILDKLQVPYKSSGRIEYFQSAVIQGMRRLGVKILILDELNNVILGNPAKQREFLQIIKYIANELELSIVASGTEDAFYVVNSDDQLANRFDKVVLSRWRYDAEYLRMLASLEKAIGLKQDSNLIEQPLAMKILEMSEGILGEIVRAVREAAVHEIKSGKEKITLKTLSEIKWTLPSLKRSRELLR